MLHGVRELYRFSIEVAGEGIGRVRDAYFDNRQWPWPLRYLVVDTGSRQILISPRSVTGMDHDRKVLHTTLTMAHVAESSSAEVDFNHSEGFPRRWLSEQSIDIDSAPYTASAGTSEASPVLAAEASYEEPGHGDPYVRSTRSVTHHYVHALDGDIGHVADFLYEETSWRIRYVVAATGSWWPGRKVLIPVGYVSWLSWDAHTLNVQVPRETIQLAPSYHAGQPATEEYLARLAVHYASSLE